MLHEAMAKQWTHALPLFEAPHMALTARAVACGNAPGRLWIDEPIRPRFGLLWDRGHHLYLAGNAAAAPAAAVRDILHRTILPGMQVGGSSRYEAHAANEALALLWDRLLPKAIRRARMLFSSDEITRAIATPPVEAGMPLRRIDESLLLDNELGHVRDVRNEVAGMWGSVEAFLRGGFGYCIVSGREIVCWCTAEYVSPGWCGVGIETVREYQGRGLATAAATALLSHCVERGIRMHWDCWADNTPSVRVAEKIGLAAIERFEVVCGRLADLPRHV